MRLTAQYAPAFIIFIWQNTTYVEFIKPAGIVRKFYIFRRMKMKKIVLVLGITVLLFATFNPTSASAQSNVASYYVRANGNDSNNGTTEARPFKTLAKAVEAASKTNVKKITVIGKLDGQTAIKDSGSDEIFITGKADASDNDKAVITTSSTERVSTIEITGNSNIRLENITIRRESAFNIVSVQGSNTVLTLGRDAIIFGNGTEIQNYTGAGAGIFLIEGKVIMRDNATVTNCYANMGGGVALGEGASMIMQDNAVISNNKAAIAGGGVFVQNGNLELRNNAVIKGNIALRDNFERGGGGIYSVDSSVALYDNSIVTGNSAPHGGGIYLRFSQIKIDDGESNGRSVYESRHVSGNTATRSLHGQGAITHNIFHMDM